MPSTLTNRLAEFGQEHVLAFWDRLTLNEQDQFEHQLRSLDLPLLQQLYEQRHRVATLPPRETLAPLPLVRIDDDDVALRNRGEEAMRQGAVAALMVAGGQGTRLGADTPKGMFPIAPVSGKSLFQWHAEKVVATSRHYGVPLPLWIMTSPATHDATRSFFTQNNNFGVQEVVFFQQGVMPALDAESGKLLLESPGSICVSPDGHGGLVQALDQAGLLRAAVKRGIRTLAYFQVDNPLVRIVDPAFLGLHLRERAEVSTKVTPKRSPDDKVGNLLLAGGRCCMIEYSDLPRDLAQLKQDNGSLFSWAGNTANHLWEIAFLRGASEDAGSLPFHTAVKKVPHLDAAGRRIEPSHANALKFERFIFDLLPHAARACSVAVERAQEYTPLKNATGDASPDAVRAAMSEQAARWLQQAGAQVPRLGDGRLTAPMEISPLAAWEPRALRLGAQFKIAARQPVHVQ